ncbi:DUF3611 family protein [Phormidesmis sp. 146-35]
MTKSDPPTLRQIASTFRLTGWISFWVQLVLTVISSAILLFASVSNRTPTTNPGTSVGVVLTVCGIGVLGFNMFWAIARYVSIGRRLDGAPEIRPKKADAIQTLRMGLIASLIGTLLALLGAEAIVGLLFGKAVSQGVAGFVNTDPAKFIQPLDILVVQASINVILAQFCAISASLWLLNKMSRQ